MFQILSVGILRQRTAISFAELQVSIRWFHYIFQSLIYSLYPFYFLIFTFDCLLCLEIFESLLSDVILLFEILLFGYE
jgi:hypothetical protein